MKLIVILALLLGGCSAILGYSAYKTAASGAVDQAILDRMEYNDKKAVVVRSLACDMSLGAYARMPAGNVKTGVGLICGIQPDLPPMIIVSSGTEAEPVVRVVPQVPQGEFIE